jgi:hypothetical protein
MCPGGQLRPARSCEKMGAQKELCEQIKEKTEAFIEGYCSYAPRNSRIPIARLYEEVCVVYCAHQIDTYCLPFEEKAAKLLQKQRGGPLQKRHRMPPLNKAGKTFEKEYTAAMSETYSQKIVRQAWDFITGRRGTKLPASDAK